MNKRGTNRFVAILNAIAIASLYIFYFSGELLTSGLMHINTDIKSLYDSFLIETLINNLGTILFLVYGGIGILNIICAIQNKENKKIFFWQLVFGLYEIWFAFFNSDFLNNDDVSHIVWIAVNVIPIILAIINFFRIRKNRPKVIQVISYVAVIIIAILGLLGILEENYWNIIAVIMQFIYIHFQDKNIEESSARKIVNVILYYVLQSILAIGFLLMILASLIITKINEVQLENAKAELNNSIVTLQGNKESELYIPVEKNYKYGFITEDGQERIPCEYDRVSFFTEMEINNNTYYIALAQKDNKFYIISKTNASIELSGVLEKYVQAVNSTLDIYLTNINDGIHRLQYIESYNALLTAATTKGEKQLSSQQLESRYYSSADEVTLRRINTGYMYASQNFSMIIEPILEENEEYSDDYYDEDEDTYYMSTVEEECKVTILKSNGEEQSSIVCLPGLDEDDLTLETFNNGFIEFETKDYSVTGWYDNNGNQTTISGDYSIIDIYDVDDGEIYVQMIYYNENYDGSTESEYNWNNIIIDTTGNILLQTPALDIYDSDIYNTVYLIKNNNNKMVLLDKDFKEISNEYDKIITNSQIDISTEYSSY